MTYILLINASLLDLKSPWQLCFDLLFFQAENVGSFIIRETQMMQWYARPDHKMASQPNHMRSSVNWLRSHWVCSDLMHHSNLLVFFLWHGFIFTVHFYRDVYSLKVLVVVLMILHVYRLLLVPYYYINILSETLNIISGRH